MVDQLPGREALALDLAGHCIYLAQDGACDPMPGPLNFSGVPAKAQSLQMAT